MRATIVIPTYNKASFLAKALESLGRMVPVDGFEVVVLVVDNRCTDATPEVVERYSSTASVRVTRVVEDVQGLNHARNRGVAASDGDWLIFLDDDMEADEGWMGGLAASILSHDPDIVVGPVEPIFEDPGAALLGPGILRSVTSEYSRKGRDPCLLSPNQGGDIPGCNFAVRRSTAIELGGFHPALDRCGAGMLAGGDTEFGLRAARAGRRIAYSPACRVRHWISSAKTSHAGLRERLKGLGATQRAIQALEGNPPSLSRRGRLLLRMLRLQAEEALLRMSGRAGRAFEKELAALRLRSYLFGAPKSLLQVGPWNGPVRDGGEDPSTGPGRGPEPSVSREGSRA